MNQYTLLPARLWLLLCFWHACIYVMTCKSILLLLLHMYTKIMYISRSHRIYSHIPSKKIILAGTFGFFPSQYS